MWKKKLLSGFWKHHHSRDDIDLCKKRLLLANKMANDSTVALRDGRERRKLEKEPREESRRVSNAGRRREYCPVIVCP